MAEVLKPCPFCGEVPEVVEALDTGYTILNSERYSSGKPLCYGCGNCDYGFSNKEDTIRAWNMRNGKYEE
jgi:Lar family restriction alleviation protein